MEHIIHTVVHCFEDSVKILPFLFLTYLLMEWIEHRAGERTEKLVRRAGKAGPVLGALLGLVPQCGFSAAASGLFSGRLISAGTLLAVFLSTSDELIPVFVSRGVALSSILIILASKLAVAIAAGYLLDAVYKSSRVGRLEPHCEDEGCHCGERGIFLSALFHTVKIFVFIFIFSTAFHAAVELVGEERLAGLFSGLPVVSNLIASVIGLIPNCASSVVIAELYLEGILSAGAMMSGLFVGAGTGLLVLFRVHRDRRESLLFVLVLFAVGTLAGALLDLVGMGAWLS